MSEENFMPFFQPKNIFTTEVRGQQHTYYLTGPITEPENYVDLCNILRSSGPQDEILIRINSRGGSVASERMVINAIQESEANVVGFIEYDCMSAATGIFLACKQHGWAEHIQFMAHCAFWGSVGKNPDVKSQTEFGIKQLEEEITSTYKGLLTDEEVLLCNDGKEFWFGAKELATRMENFYEYQKSLPCDCGSPECQANQALEEDFDEMPSLAEIIAAAVELGVKKALAARDAKEKKALKLVPVEDKKGSLHLRVFPNWHLAKYDIEEHREAGELDGNKITKFYVKQAKATLENGDYILWMVSNEKDTDKFQGLCPVTAFLHDGVDDTSREYITARIMS